ncbi:MAG: rhodanese-like domain-containing protein, partial [Planctomycetota bacterium]
LVERADALPPALDVQAARALLAAGGWIVDLRDQSRYAAAHVEGAINVALRGRLDTWTGTVVPSDGRLALVGTDAEVREGAFRLRRIGYDTIAGRLGDDPEAWRQAGLTIRSSRLVQPRELHAAMQAGTEPMIVDVRTADEYEDVRLGDIGNIPVTDSERFAKVLAKETPVVAVCNSAYRSSMAVGLLERSGFRDVGSLAGGMDAWLEADLPVKGRAALPAAPPPGKLALPEPIDPLMLAKVLAEQPASYAVLDLRPAWQFAEWTLPGAANVAADALAAHLAKLPAETRVVLIDRDGTHAFAVAGAVMARAPERTLRVLVGGVQMYWRTAMLGVGRPDAAVPPGPTTTPAAPAAPAAKKRSAGC